LKTGNRFNDKLITSDSKETQNLGEKIGSILQADDVIALEGELGSGKTTLTQGIARGLGISDWVNSPSFIIVNEYAGRLPLFHIDLYRLENFSEIEDIGVEDYYQRGGVVVIEWAQKLGRHLPEKTRLIKLKYLEENKREICLPLELAAQLK
jgi:tRNA threonylcarbamoyladenosine biosynthesis protein TsaE